MAIVLLRGVEVIFNEFLREAVEAALNYFYKDFDLSIYKYLTPPEAFNPRRNQYDASKLISFLNKQEKLVGKDVTIALIDEDIYYENLYYVFGLAGVKSGKIIVSTYRLKMNYSMTSHASVDTFKERVFKELLHELGHLNGLNHCPNKSCVMSFSSTLKEVDEKLPMFCEDCRRRLE